MVASRVHRFRPEAAAAKATAVAATAPMVTAAASMKAAATAPGLNFLGDEGKAPQ
jgi:hypothetical protein